MAGLILMAAGGLAIGGLASCGRGKPEVQAPPEFPLILEGQTNLILGGEGLAVLSKDGLVVPSSGLVASQAPRVAALASKGPRDSVLIAALNRYGLAMVEASPDRTAFKLRNIPRPEFAGRSVAALWSRGPSWLLELYRDPFVTPIQPRSDQDPELLAIDGEAGLRVLPRMGRPGEDLFALYPGPRGRWYAEFRTEQKLGARLRYASLASPVPGPDGRIEGLQDLRRDLFEASLAPRPLSAAPSALRRAAGALETGPILVHALGEDGQDGFWLSSGPAEDAREASAWIGSGEDSALILLRSGEGAWAGKDGVKTFRIAPAISGAEYGPVAGLFPAEGKSGKTIVAAAWIQGQFPGVSASGLSLLALEP